MVLRDISRICQQPELLLLRKLGALTGGRLRRWQGLMMTAYLKWRGLPETVISLYRGGGALSGIAATLLFPRIQRKLGGDNLPQPHQPDHPWQSGQD